MARTNVWQHNMLLDVPAAVALGNALRASSTLTALSLRASNLWREPAAATALLGALAGHSRLRSLNVSGNQVDEASRDRAGAWIAALLAANAQTHHVAVSVQRARSCRGCERISKCSGQLSAVPSEDADTDARRCRASARGADTMSK